MPTVSVSIPAYNEEDIIGRTIENVLDQTFEDFELLIVDDGSTDDTRTVVEEYTDDPRVRYIYQENQGFPGARNTGLEEGEGEYYAFIGADDLWAPTKLQKQVAYLEDTDADMVHSNVYHIDATGQITGVRWDKHPPATDDREQFLRKLFMHNFICIQSVIVHRDHIEHRRFDEELQINCDHDMWLRVAEDAHIEYVGEKLVRKRYDGGNISSNYERLFEERRQLAEKAADRYPFLEDLRDRKLASIHLTYGINLIADGDLATGRDALRQAISYDATNWRSYATYLLSFAGPRTVQAVAKEV
ncbi:MAG: glycosyltransferase family 2 protein [Halobacteriales archaeon]